MLKPIKDTGKRKYGTIPIWLYQCECGNQKEIRKDSVTQGRTNSCGCLHKKKAKHGKDCNLYKHGKRNTVEYTSWSHMRARCFNSNNKDYKNYGGRDITICERWNEFENFYNDMGKKPKGMTLGRIDNDGDYTPENCRWETYSQQNKNRRFDNFKGNCGRKSNDSN